MWVIFRKSDGQVMGTSGDTGAVPKKGDALDAVAGGLPDRDGDVKVEYDAIQIEEHSEEGSRLLKALLLGQASIQEDPGGIPRVVEEEVPAATAVTIAANARESHPVDNVPLIPGDGTSFLVVTLQKILEEGRTPLTGAEDSDVIWLRTSHGSLRENKDDNPQEIRSVKLVRGTAKFRLYSEKAKRLATVDMLSENPNLRLPGLRVEFI
jgi:hypothetical protein